MKHDTFEARSTSGNGTNASMQDVTRLHLTGRSSSVGSVIASYAIGLEVNPRVQHIDRAFHVSKSAILVSCLNQLIFQAATTNELFTLSIGPSGKIARGNSRKYLYTV